VVTYIDAGMLLRIAEGLPDLTVEVRDLGLLESAVARPAASMFGTEAYPTIHLKAAALMDSVSNNHSLIDGNKRLGLIATAVFYEMNGYDFDPPHDDVLQLCLSIADGSNRDLPTIAASLAEWVTPLA
jgi:death-on-curing protein